MFFNILDTQKRGRAQIIIIRRQMLLERRLRRKMKELLNHQFMVIAKHAEQGIFDVEHTIDSLRGYMLKALSEQYTRIGGNFFSWVQTSYLKNKSGHRKSIEPIESKINWNEGAAGAAAGAIPPTTGMAAEFWRAFNIWTLKQTAQKVSEIGKTTKKILRKTIQDSINEGASYKVVADNIMEKAKEINKNRAMKIARTEVHAAATYAVDESVKSTRVKFERIWTSILDERTREDHKIVDGQSREMNEPFDVGGENLMFPGDPSGSPGNVINCRCILTYKNKDLQRYFD